MMPLSLLMPLRHCRLLMPLRARALLAIYADVAASALLWRTRHLIRCYEVRADARLRARHVAAFSITPLLFTCCHADILRYADMRELMPICRRYFFHTRCRCSLRCAMPRFFSQDAAARVLR